MGQESRHSLVGSSAWGHKAVISELTGLHSHGSSIGEEFVSMLILCWALWLKSQIFCLLSAGGHPYVLEAFCNSLPLQYGHILHQASNKSLSNTFATFYWLKANHMSCLHSRKVHIRLKDYGALGVRKTRCEAQPYHHLAVCSWTSSWVSPSLSLPMYKMG